MPFLSLAVETLRHTCNSSCGGGQGGGRHTDTRHQCLWPLWATSLVSTRWPHIQTDIHNIMFLKVWGWGCILVSRELSSSHSIKLDQVLKVTYSCTASLKPAWISQNPVCLSVSFRVSVCVSHTHRHTHTLKV